MNPNLSTLCFHGLTNCFSRNHFVLINICVAPRGVPSATSVYPDLRGVLRPPCPAPAPTSRGVALFSSTLSLSSGCGLFVSLAALFAGATLCFQSFADSFAKNRGVGVPAHSSAPLTIHRSLPTFWFIRQLAWWRQVRGCRCGSSC